jgi:hypothetical protein
MFEIITSALLVLAALGLGLALIGYAARQWRKMRRGQ